MKYYLWLLIVIVFLNCTNLTHQKKDYPIKPVPFTQVQINDDFWMPRIKTNREVTIPSCFRKCEETGRIDNFSIAAGLLKGDHKGRFSNDSDVFKIMEGAFYSLDQSHNKQLDTYLDSLTILIAEAQEEDGYLYTARTIDPDISSVKAGRTRWSNIYSSHELYNAGHLYEAAVASYMVSGKEILLDVAKKNAELINKTFGWDKRVGAPGHQEIEIGLVKMYRITGEEKYLNLAKFFLNARGQHKKQIDPGSLEIFQYNQSHKPVDEQEEAVGHAVRATYMYSAMADVAALTGEEAYIHSIDQIWKNIVSKKMYITGGIGSNHKGEAFGDNYQLANAGAYNETCAAIGNALFNHRLFLLHGDGKYIDVLERILYNGFLSGVSLSGDLFFYSNPLESDGKFLFNKGKATRQKWFNCSCCPSNVVRFMPSIPGYIYAIRDNELYINLYIGNFTTVNIRGNSVGIHQQTDYPWNGQIKIKLNPEKEKKFTLKVRIPGWARHQPVPSDLYRYMTDSDVNYNIKVNNESVAPSVETGYAVIRRKWKKGDTIELDIPMPVRQVVSHPNVAEDRNKVALQRGPLLYCSEWVDNGPVTDLIIPDGSVFQSEYRQSLLNGITVITGEVDSKSGQQHSLTAIPYYAWSNRGVGEMAVWLPRRK